MQKQVVNTRQFISVCLGLMRRSAELIHQVRTSETKATVMKGVNDPVTQADLMAQYVIEKGIRHYWPGIAIVGEESEQSMIATEFDPATCFKDLQVPELAAFDNEYDLDDLVVYIDPLDGTASFVSGYYTDVCTHIGLAYRHQPLVGMINHIYPDRADTFDPHTYVGRIDHPVVYEISNSAKAPVKVARSHLPFKDYPTEDKVFTMSVSINHYDPVVEELLKIMGKTQKYTCAGCGNKYLRIIRGEIDGYVFNVSGTSRWDSLPGEVMMRALGAESTGCRGEIYTYPNERVDLFNTAGLFALNNKREHDRLITKFREFYRSINLETGPLLPVKKAKVVLPEPNEGQVVLK